MTKSGLADSPFFSAPSIAPVPATSPVVEKPSKDVVEKGDLASIENKKPKHRDTVIPRHHDTVVSSNHATTTPSNRGTTVSDNQDAMIETIRKSVKELGKEAATHRFTVDEKRAVLDLIYSYKSAGIKTHENEVTRISLNYVLEDYKQNGRNSILDKVLKALNE